MVRFGTCILVSGAFILGCAPPSERPKEYELNGQLLAVDPARQEVTIKHDDIPGFMPAMTMAYKVREAKLLEGRVPGDIVKATLVVEGSEPHLRRLEKTGHAPVSEPAPLPALTPLDKGQPVEDAALIDETGAPWALSNARGNVVAVTFMYTRCPLPDFCPLMDRHFKAVQDAIRADPALKGRVRLVSVSLDPEHDTPKVLTGHARMLKADGGIWHFVTGGTDNVAKFAGQFGVSVSREGPEILHNLRTAVIDNQGRLVTLWKGTEWSPSDLVSELRNAR
jgi:protein SCO1